MRFTASGKEAVSSGSLRAGGSSEERREGKPRSAWEQGRLAVPRADTGECGTRQAPQLQRASANPAAIRAVPQNSGAPDDVNKLLVGLLWILLAAHEA